MESIVSCLVVPEKYPRGTLALSSDPNPAVALLSCCHSWRALLISQLCSEFYFLIEEKNELVVTSFPRWPKELRQPGFPACALVKEVRFQVVMWKSLMDGSALRKLLGSPYSNAVFPTASLLTVSVVDSSASINCADSLITTAREYIGEISQRIRSMVPAAREARISWPNVYHTGAKQELANIFSPETSALYMGLKRISFTEIGGFDTPGDIPTFGNIGLTHLTIRCKSSKSSFIRLARNCAPTLRELIIYEFPKDGSTLLRGSDGVPAVYSKLEKLYIAQSIGIQGLSLPQSGSMSHFPALRSLDIRCKYPFDDDVLFRGNHESLEHISVPLDMQFMAMSAENDVFQPMKFTRLHSIDLLNYYGAQEMTPYHIDTIKDFVFKLARAGTPEHLQIVRWSGPSDETKLLYGIKHNKTLSNMRILEISKSVFQFSDVVVILKAMPLLKKLWFSLDKKVPMLDGVRMPKLLTHLLANYYPLSRSLYSVTFDQGSKASAKQVAVVAMLLAVVSPTLALTQVDSEMKADYFSGIEAAIVTRPFQKHAERIKPLAKSL
ncbi:hypothetical protein LPJ53_004558 [Coemansia erecta]|uniref:F-box domain-containing protein n=1 Tax=Coemansia erecta TaxID=147472 RepID=A0A9W7XXI8_9FUNG|nr:hypothetical protein LPJ53_004558 [Coemansia erecta]